MAVTDNLAGLQKRCHVPPSANFRAGYAAPVEHEASIITSLKMRKLSDEDLQPLAGSFRKRYSRGEGRLLQKPLQDMLMDGLTFKCSDPKDHIYALLGICGQHPESPPIRIDYRRSVQELFAEVMRLLLQHTNNLWWVAQIKDSAHQKVEGLPSWVKDFSQPGLGSFTAAAFRADGGMDFNTMIDSSLGWNELPINAIYIGVVKSTASERPSDGRMTKIHLDLLWFTLLQEMPSTYITGQPRTEVLWRTLCADSASASAYSDDNTIQEGRFPATDNYAALFRAQLCAMILARIEQAQSSAAGDDFREGTASARSPFPQDVCRALDLLDEFAEHDGSSNALPTRAEVEEYIRTPKYRVWLPSTKALGDA